jgi:hypothetical protein
VSHDVILASVMFATFSAFSGTSLQDKFFGIAFARRNAANAKTS